MAGWVLSFTTQAPTGFQHRLPGVTMPNNGGFSTSIGIGMGKRVSGATLERLASGMQPNPRCPQQGGKECDDVFHTVTG